MLFRLFAVNHQAAVVVVENDPRTDTFFRPFRMRGIEVHLSCDNAAERSAGVVAQIRFIVEAEEAPGPLMRYDAVKTFPFVLRASITSKACQKVQVLRLTAKSLDQGLRIQLTPHELGFVKEIFVLLPNRHRRRADWDKADR